MWAYKSRIIIRELENGSLDGQIFQEGSQTLPLYCPYIFWQIFTITHFLVRRERFHIIFCTYNSATFIAVFLLHTYSFYTRSGKLFRFSDAFYRALEKEALYCHCSYYTGRIFFNEVWKIAAQHSMQKFVFYYELEGLSCFPYICEC